ncbi:MAG: UDP-glucose/GDP-mannose dehydrogenase family protein [Candidatus Aenigmarchaeota archaeon]|nr:UDP-glucose/GDP-mannose dehydrogenase family protein [Candidatus Aenigmarchaeota archaeon]
MKISVIGTGYVGLITGVCFAELGNHVVLVDVVEDKVDKINRGIAPIYEMGLDRMLRKNLGAGRVHASMGIEKAVHDTSITFISVGTPSGKDGSMDLAYVKKAVEEIGRALKTKGAYHIVVVKSTVLPGTTEDVVIPLLEKISGKKAGRDFGVAMNPEFLRESLAIEDFMNPDRIVVGGTDDETIKRVCRLYDGFSSPVIKTNPRTAEMIKYASNAFLATKISFINEIGNLCKRLGIDTYEVADAMGHDKRIERRFLDAGEGYGGSCFPKDVKAIIAKSRHSKEPLKILESVDSVNEGQPLKLVELLGRKLPSLRNKTIAILGLAFKPGTDDIREAPSLKIVGALIKSGAKIKAYDPQAADNFMREFKGITFSSKPGHALEGADACLLLTEWPELKELTDDDFKKMKSKVIIEGRRILDRSKVSGFEGLCW